MREMTKREVTNFPGVYSRRGIHRRGKHKGKVDTAFDVSFKDQDAKKVWIKVGWQADGISAKLASQYRAEWIRKIRLGEELPWRRKKVPLFSEMADLYLQWARENNAECNPTAVEAMAEKGGFLTDRCLKLFGESVLCGTFEAWAHLDLKRPAVEAAEESSHG